jgi:hypothetical protein
MARGKMENKAMKCVEDEKRRKGIGVVIVIGSG